MRTAARYVDVAPGDGHYESFYVKAADPAGGRALWLRHTIHKPPGEEPSGSVWLTWFAADGRGPHAGKATFGADSLATPAGTYVRVAECEIGAGHATGQLTIPEIDARWDLSFIDNHESLRHLPSERLYRSKLPRTKLLSPHPGASFSGTLDIDGERIELDSWPGMVGHNWGAEHAERWIWIHGAGFEGREPSDYVDIAAGRIKIGRFTTPWIANGAIALDGEVMKLGGLGKTYGTTIEERPGGCEFVVPGAGVTLRGAVGAPLERFVAWVYADPGGGEHNTINCSVADMRLRAERPGEHHVHLQVDGGAAFELGMRETDHGVPLQPFADG